jgi:tetratricopeptide (TPR) repeat protein
MRHLARLVLLGAVVSLGCGPTNARQVSSQIHAPDAGGKDASLHVAFDDIPAAQKPTVPIQLTASDGSGLALVGLEARAVVDDPLAFTELHLVFENTEDRVREGTFSIVLPQGASISRFAMKTGDRLQEGEVVEKKQAHEAYEDFLHRRQDPALLEQAAGNQFSARVFPIPPRGKKELVVSYSQEITTGTPYVLPLKGLPKIGSLSVEAYLAGHAAPAQKMAATDAVPAADFRLESKLFEQRGGLRNGNLVVTRVRPVVKSSPEPLASAVILVDTSASRALGAAEQARVVRRLCAAIAQSGDAGQVVVAAYDQAIEPIYEGPAAGFGDAQVGRMRQRLALGASNLEAALAWAGERAKASGIKRAVLVTDGIPTAGATAGDKLRARVAAWKGSVERLDAIGVGGIRDDDLLRSLANAGLAKGGVVIDGSTPEEEMVRRLSEATVSGVEVKVEGASFVFPSKLDGLQAGDEALVYANVPESSPVRISVGGGAWEKPDLARVERPLLERAWVGAKLKSLLETERTDGPSDALSREIVGLSTKFRVLSPKSALLVLETDWDYQRFGIDRTALADILVADGGRVSLLRRSIPAPPKAAPPPPKPPPPVVKSKPTPPVVRSAQVSVNGTGSGQGFGAGHGRLAGASAGAVAVPQSMSSGGAGHAVGGAAPSAHGNMWGDATGDSFGAGGLGLTGAGEGGGGRGEGIGLGTIGTIGHGAGTGSSSQGASGHTTTPPPSAPMVSAAPSLQAAPRASDDERAPAEASRTAAELEAERPPRDGETRQARPFAPGGEEIPEMDRVQPADPYAGPFRGVMAMLAEGRVNDGVAAAFAWRKRDPGDVLALVALGEGFEAAGDLAQAARCYGSIVDLFPARADMRRFAGERLERLALPAALDLAADTFEKAEEERPDHPASHRLLAYAQLRKGQHEKAFETIVRGLHHAYPSGRFAGVPRILAEDVGLIGAAWARAEPARATEILRRVREEGGLIEDQPSIRFVLNWETDANDVDFHIHDAKGGHAFYARPELPSGGRLYADVTTGYGPECFTIRGRASERSAPYVLQANYYSRGPMGYGMGKLEIIEHDGHGGLKFEERPYIVMNDRAFVDLGTVKR